MAEPTPPVENPNEPVAPAAVVPDPAAVPAPDVPVAPVVPVVDAPSPTPDPVADPAPVYDLKIGDKAIDPGLVAALTPFFKEAGVTAKQAQGMASAFEAHRVAMLPQIMARDLDALRADPELGKLNFGRTQTRVNDALAAFTTPQERAALTSMGIANNPNLVRMFHRIGTAMQEPPQTDAGPQVREKLPTQTKLYGGRDLKTSGPARTN